MAWKMNRNEVYEQNIVLVGLKGDQKFDTMRCCILNFPQGQHLQYPRSIFRNNRKFVLLKYSQKQNLVFYKLLEELNEKTT